MLFLQRLPSAESYHFISHFLEANLGFDLSKKEAGYASTNEAQRRKNNIFSYASSEKEEKTKKPPHRCIMSASSLSARAEYSDLMSMMNSGESDIIWDHRLARVSMIFAWSAKCRFSHSIVKKSSHMALLIFFFLCPWFSGFILEPYHPLFCIYISLYLGLEHSKIVSAIICYNELPLLCAAYSRLLWYVNLFFCTILANHGCTLMRRCTNVVLCQSTLVISNSKELTETLRDIRTSTYQS